MGLDMWPRSTRKHTHIAHARQPANLVSTSGPQTRKPALMQTRNAGTLEHDNIQAHVHSSMQTQAHAQSCAINHGCPHALPPAPIGFPFFWVNNSKTTNRGTPLVQSRSIMQHRGRRTNVSHTSGGLSRCLSPFVAHRGEFTVASFGT